MRLVKDGGLGVLCALSPQVRVSIAHYGIFRLLEHTSDNRVDGYLTIRQMMIDDWGALAGSRIRGIPVSLILSRSIVLPHRIMANLSNALFQPLLLLASEASSILRMRYAS